MNRKGKIKVLQENLKKTPEIFNELGFVVLRAEYLYAEDVIEYIGVSHKFDEIQEGEMLPEYELSIGDNKAISVSRT